MPATNNMISYVLCSRAQYDAMASHESRVLYFLADTKELYRGDSNYSAAVVTHNADGRPAVGAIGKLYINSTNGEGTVYNGTTWSVVIPAVSSTVLNGDVGVTNPVSGAAVKSYVESVAASTLAQCVTAVGYDTANKAITYVVNGQTTSVPLTKLGVTLAYDGATGVIALKDLEGTTLSSANIPLDNFITGGSYNDTTKNLVLTMQNGTTVNIPAADLVQLYHDLDSTTVDITIATDETTGQNTIKADVKISAQADNALEVKADGMYVPPSTTKMDKVGAGHTDEVVVADAQGNASASGYKAGGATIDATVANRATNLATEAAVMAVKSEIEQDAQSTYVPLANIITSASQIDVDDPDTTKVLSEAAVVEAMSWIELSDESGNVEP